MNQRIRTMNTEIQERDCAVCLQKCHHPTQLPCGHIFCFLCVKGVAIQNKKCAMCRAEIPADYLDHPILLEKISPEQTSTRRDIEQYQWYYEGRNGWWKYDERSNRELERAFNAEDTECNLLLAGALYCINFQNMMQIRRSDATRRRRVRRDVPTFPAKGIAGIKNIENTNAEQTKHESEDINETTPSPSEHETSDIVNESTQSVLSDSDSSSAHSNEYDEIIHQFSIVNFQEQESPQDSSPTREDT